MPAAPPDVELMVDARAGTGRSPWWSAKERCLDPVDLPHRRDGSTPDILDEMFSKETQSTPVTEHENTGPVVRGIIRPMHCNPEHCYNEREGITKTAIRRMGNSRGVITPKPVLAQVGPMNSARISQLRPNGRSTRTTEPPIFRPA
jgi:hypothetical protein